MARDDSPIATLERWEQHGGVWQAISITESTATVELRTCLGEPVDQLRSSDSELIAYVTGRPRSD